MEKLYGHQLRHEAGLVRTLKAAFPPPVAKSVSLLEQRVDNLLAETRGTVEDFLIQVGPKFEQGVAGFVKDTRFMFSQYPAKLSITKLADDLRNYDMSMYKLAIVNKNEEPMMGPVDRAGYKSLIVPYGEPIRVAWEAPRNHSKKDWIGLYRIADNASREVTRIGSLGRWVAVCPDQYDTKRADIGCVTTDFPGRNEDNEPIFHGEVVFAAEKTFWLEGSYEFRYHHAGKHSVMAISLPFEIACPRVLDLPLPMALDDEDVRGSWTEEAVMAAVEERLLPVVRNCFDGDEGDGAPETVLDMWGGQGEGGVHAKRVVYAVKCMFGVDFAPEVVQADGCVRRLGWRVCNARKVLAPFSMSGSTGSSTPGTPRY